MASIPDVCIRGGGVVGRTLALLLAHQRLRVTLVAPKFVPPASQSPSGHSDVRAYALNLASRKLLESVRAWPDEMHATAVREMQVHGDNGGEVHFATHDSALAWIVDVPALEARLAEAAKFQPSIEVVSGHAQDALDGPHRKAKLTVICEGKSSRTRNEYGVDFTVTPYRQTAIAARVDCEVPHGQIARQWFANGEILAFLPLSGAEGNSVAIVWSLNQQHAEELQALDDEAFQMALETASSNALGKLKMSSERAAWPLQLSKANRWVGPGWALAGDAAHTVHPLAGQGLNLGLADAAELARVLAEKEEWRSVGDERLLRRYERARQPDMLAMIAATDGLQKLFEPQHVWIKSARNLGMSGFERSGMLKSWIAKRAMGIGVD